MSDNDRKNAHEINQDRKRHDPLEDLAQIFNSNKQNKNQSYLSLSQTDQSEFQSPESLFHDSDFDLPFLEAELEKTLTGDLSYDDQNKQLDLKSSGSATISMDEVGITTLDNSRQKSFLSNEIHSSSIDLDEEKILDALSPLPIQKNQSPQNKMEQPHIDPFFEGDTQDNQISYNSSINYPHKIPDDRKEKTKETASIVQSPSNLDSTKVDKSFDVKGLTRENHVADHPQFYEKFFLNQKGNAEKKSKHNDTHIRYSRNFENLSDHNSKRKTSYNHTYKNSPPPNVDVYQFTEEVVEQTGPIMVPEVPYEAPECGMPSDSLREEFADVFKVGNISVEDFSQKKQNETFDDFFHQHMQNLEKDSPMNIQKQNDDYFSAQNAEHSTSSFQENLPYGNVDEIFANNESSLVQKSFIFNNFLKKSAILFILITICFISYFYFFTPSQQAENIPIIRADSAPFKFKQEITETENDDAHNLDIYKQATEQREKQRNTQTFLVDNSESPESLTTLEKQTSENISSSLSDESDVENAVAEATNQTVPTREVQTVIVNQDGTIALTQAHKMDKEYTDDSETIDSIAIDEPKDEPSIFSQFSDRSNKETEHNSSNNIDAIISENSSVPDIKKKAKSSFIPVPYKPKFISRAKTHTTPHPTSSPQTTTQSLESYYVQFASQPTAELARDSLKNIKSKFQYIIGSHHLNIYPALIPGKGIYYRVRVQTQNRNEAISLCEEVKNSGGSCFITR
ncbi:SPOR domain-containing protein [Bartonella sp. B41]